MSTFVLFRKTAKSVIFSPADYVKADGPAYSWKPSKDHRTNQVARDLKEAADTLPHAQRSIPAIVYERACERDPGLRVTTSYSPKQSNGRPAMVVVK